MEIILTPNEIKVLKQIVSLDYGKGLQTPGVNMDFVASETGLTYQEADEALKGLHYNKANILKARHHNQEHWKTVEVTDWTYDVARSFN